jgi:hypothetical protein
MGIAETEYHRIPNAIERAYAGIQKGGGTRLPHVLLSANHPLGFVQ